MKLTSYLRNALAATLILSFFSVGIAPAAEEEKDYLLATATTGGTYYPVGVALSTLTKVKLQADHKIGMSAISSAGSGENIKMMRDNEVQFSILQGLYGYWAWNGTGQLVQDGPQKDLRSITMLWQNVEHFVIDSSKAKTGTIADMVELKGTRMSMGQKNSGTLGSNEVILANLGVDIAKDYDLVYIGYGPSADALQDGQITGMSTPAGVPASAVTRVLATMGDKVTLLGFTEEQVAAIHKATTDMHIDKALAGLPMPLHPGAARYYQEVGLTIPDHLISK